MGIRFSGSDGTEVRGDFKGKDCNLFPEFRTQPVDLSKDAGRQLLSETKIRFFLQQNVTSISFQETLSSFGVWLRQYYFMDP